MLEQVRRLLIAVEDTGWAAARRGGRLMFGRVACNLWRGIDVETLALPLGQPWHTAPRHVMTSRQRRADMYFVRLSCFVDGIVCGEDQGRPMQR